MRSLVVLFLLFLVVGALFSAEAASRRTRVRSLARHKSLAGPPRVALASNFMAYCKAILSVADVVKKMQDVIDQDANDDSLDEAAITSTFCSALTDPKANDATHCTFIAIDFIFDPNTLILIDTIKSGGPTVDDVCDQLKPEYDESSAFWTSTDIANRFGIESEIRMAYVFALFDIPTNGKVSRDTMGVVSYSQPLVKTVGKLLDIPLFQVTVDAVNNKFQNTFLADSAKAVIGGRYGVHPDNMAVDETGIRGMAEFVTAPVTAASPEYSGIAAYRGMQLLLNSMKKLAKACNSPDKVDATYPYGSGAKAIPWSDIVTEYNTELAKLTFTDIDSGSTSYKDKLKLELVPDSLAKTNYYLRCGDYDFYTQHTQVNYAMPVTKWTKEKMHSVMIDPLAKDWVSRCETSATAYMASAFSAIASTDTKFPLIRNLFSLMTFVSLAESYNIKAISNKQRSAHLAKDTYDQLPKVNLPDLVRLMPSGVRTALATWYDSVKSSLPTVAGTLIDGLGLPSSGYFSGLRDKISKTTPIFQLKESRNALDTVAKKKGSLANLKTTAKARLAAALKQIFAFHGTGTACHGRYPGDNPTSKAYSSSVDTEYTERSKCVDPTTGRNYVDTSGTEIEYTLNWRDFMYGSCTFNRKTVPDFSACYECPRYLPAGGSDTTPYFVVEARMYQNSEVNKLVEIKSTTYGTTSLSGGGFNKISVMQ